MNKPARASRRANRRADPSATRTLADPNGGIAGPDEIAASQARQARADGERGHATSVAPSRRGRARESAYTWGDVEHAARDLIGECRRLEVRLAALEELYQRRR
jgi:hypothetical protein